VVTRSTLKQYRHSTAVTELKQFEHRGHSLTIDSGWTEVAEAILQWLRTHGIWPSGQARLVAQIMQFWPSNGPWVDDQVADQIGGSARVLLHAPVTDADTAVEVVNDYPGVDPAVTGLPLRRHLSPRGLPSRSEGPRDPDDTLNAAESRTATVAVWMREPWLRPWPRART
jgi:hypothetical protein